MLGFPAAAARPDTWSRRRVTPTLAPNGMVASGHPLATSAGLDVLRAGGNAVDAAVAAGLVCAVVMPEMCGLGGDLFALIGRRVGRDGREETGDRDGLATGDGGHEVFSVQGSGIAPRSATLDRVRDAGSGTAMPGRGPLSVTVPGMVHAYFTLLGRFGTRTFADLVEPAIGYAEGHPISPTRVSYVESFTDLLRSYPSSAAVFLPDGAVPHPGSVLRQPDLARTLRAIAEGGADTFYGGDIGDRICRALAELGGALSPADLAGQDTEISAPLTTTYRDHTIYQTCLPSQGLIVLEALNIAERFDLAATGVDSAASIHALVEAVKLAFADRHAYCGDPASCASPVERLLSKDWAATRSRQITGHAQQRVPAGSFDRGDTTYLCAVDREGTMVSLIQSVSANFGSGIVAGDTGVVLNNRGSGFTLDPASPNAYAPGKKPIHTLNCYLIADPAGRLVLAGGTPGADRQPQWNVQVIAGLVDDARDAQQAIEQPFWISSPTSGDGPYRLTLERRAGDSVRDQLVQRGHHVDFCGDWDIDSVAQVIARDPGTGVLCAGSDPRTEGQAAGY